MSEVKEGVFSVLQLSGSSTYLAMEVEMHNVEVSRPVQAFRVL